MSEINHAAIEVLRSFYEGDPDEQRETFEALKRAEAEDAGWISLDRQWPEYDTPVLVWIDSPHKEHGIAAHSEEDGWIILSDARSGLAANIMHWMPLPEPPSV